MPEKDDNCNVLDLIIDDTISVEDLKGCAKINIHKLDEECAIQPVLYAHASRLHAAAKHEVRKAKLFLDMVMVEQSASVRANPKEYGLERVSETAISSLLPGLPPVVDAKEALVKAECASDKTYALVNVFEQRRSMLSNEVQLATTVYFAETAAASRDRTGQDFAEKISKQRQEKQNG